MASPDFLIRQPFAHRGLHGGAIVENSRASFEAAIAVGHGIELDVQVSRDGEAFVFHDFTLERLLDGAGALAEMDADALGKVRYKTSDELLAPLSEIFAMVGGRAPVLVEIKSKDSEVEKLCAAVERAVANYDGEVAAMSYRAEASRWFADNAPDVTRGMVMSEFLGTPMMKELSNRKKRRAAIELGDPQFMAFDIRSLPSPIAAEQRDLGKPILTWTVRKPRQHKRAAEFADQIIYEEV